MSDEDAPLVIRRPPELVRGENGTEAWPASLKARQLPQAMDNGVSIVKSEVSDTPAPKQQSNEDTPPVKKGDVER